MDNITSLNITASTASSPPAVSRENEDGPHGAAAEEAADTPIFNGLSENPETASLKADLINLDPALVFTSDFYPKAAAYLAAQGFSGRFLVWLYEYCQTKKYRSLTGLYYGLFFQEQMAELFRHSLEERAPPPPPPVPMAQCPVCGTEHDRGDEECPVCGLHRALPAGEIEEHKKIYRLPEARKAAFYREQNSILNISVNFLEKAKKLDRLKKQYGIT
jgi:hypothetical protein